jgi:transitional endoplasmic reticulum ATPase
MAKYILPKNYLLNEKYSVLLSIKQSNNAETYRIKGNDGKLYFLKLFNYSKIHRSAFDAENNLLEIEILKRVKHENIVSYKDSGELIFEGKKYGFLVLDIIAGETLAEKMNRESFSVYFDIKQIITDVLNGLHYLHSLPEPIIHNEITPQNIMLDMSGDIPKAIIIDFGYARSFLHSNKAYNIEGLNLNYVASECFNGFYSPQSDIFSVGAVMYQMIFGLPPWLTDVSNTNSDLKLIEDNVIAARKKRLFINEVNSDFVDFNESIELIINKALSNDTETRFANASEFIQAVKGEIEVEDIDIIQILKPKPVPEPKQGNGFADIAGMEDLKKLMQKQVIDRLHNPEKYARHKLGLPNGILLYGPPRCGKTFFAEKFSEEANYNFIKIKCSDLGSIYVHGTQEKIGKLFDEAKKNSPSILFFDEFDAMVPDRAKENNHQSSEVNEFLIQLDNCGKSGIFVIAATNNPLAIDNAILGAGRIEKHFFIPPPDFDSRKIMFQLSLKDRPLEFCINYEKLAKLTDNYVSGDIKLIVDEASQRAINAFDEGERDNDRITMSDLEYIIKNQRPTISLEVLKKHELIKAKMNGVNISNKPPKIGFT